MYTKEEIGSAIKQARIFRNLSAIELSKLAGVAKSSVSDWENGKTQPSADALFKLCKAVKMTPDELISGNYSNGEIYAKVTKFKVPVLGTIACGKPIFAEEETNCFADSVSSEHCDFALWAKGDSMIGARIYDGDLVFIKQQEMVENGEIGAVLIGDEATLKRVYYDEVNSTLTLVAENPKYAPLVYRQDELNNIKILGKAVSFQSKIV